MRLTFSRLCSHFVLCLLAGTYCVLRSPLRCGGRASWCAGCARGYQLQQHGDPWALPQELPSSITKAHSTPPMDKG